MAITYLDDYAEKALEMGVKKIYRYYTIEYAKKSLTDGNFWFCNPTRWEDPFEKLFIEAKYNVDGKTYDFPFLNRLFCICLTEENNSLASWKAYSDNQIAIRFEINSKAFIELLEFQTDYYVYIGKVNYKATKYINGRNGPVDFDLKDLFSESKSDKDKLSLLLLKRYAFRYEKEFRIILISKWQSEYQKGVEIKFDKSTIHKLIPQIMIGPSKEEKMVYELKNQFENFGIKDVRHSKLISPLEPRNYKLKSINT